METQTESTDTPPPTDEQIGAAKAHLKKYQDVAADAESKRDRWRIAFEREPTVEARDNRDIWTQKAINARAAADAYDRDVVRPAVARQRRAEIGKYETEVLNQQAGAIAALEGAFDKLVDAISAFDSAIGDWESLHHARVLAASRGVGLSAAFSLRREIERLAPRLQRFGGPTGHHTNGANAASVVLMQPDQNEAHVKIHIARKANAVPLPTRSQ
jgi:hypothetical protein